MEVKQWMNQTEFVIHYKMDIPMPEAKGKLALYMSSNGEELPKQMMLVDVEILQNDGSYKKSIVEVEIPK